MNIHHYTRASTLPLILESGKIRFTRADLLDDGSEIPYKTAHLDAQNFFISSWTNIASEHSGQWFRYGDQHRGVRISLPTNPFKFHTINFELKQNCTIPGLERNKVGISIKDTIAPFTAEEMLGSGYTIMSYAADMSKCFGGNVEYVASPSKRAFELITEVDGETTFDDSGDFGRIKSSDWADQAEYRFVLMAMAGPNLDRESDINSYNQSLFKICEDGFINKRMAAPSAKFIDIKLSQESIDKMTITLGSKISEADRIQVIKSVARHAPNVQIIESSMNIR